MPSAKEMMINALYHSLAIFSQRDSLGIAGILLKAGDSRLSADIGRLETCGNDRKFGIINDYQNLRGFAAKSI